MSLYMPWLTKYYISFELSCFFIAFEAYLFKVIPETDTVAIEIAITHVRIFYSFL